MILYLKEIGKVIIKICVLDFHMCDWEFIIENWEIIAFLIGLPIGYVGGRYKLASGFPRYTIIFSRGLLREGFESSHLEVKNMTDNEVVTNPIFSYITPDMDDWKICIRGNRLNAKKGDIEPGGWWPGIKPKTKKEKTIFSIPPSTDRIIWKMEYKSKLFTHISYEMFVWENEKWETVGWNGYYTQGTLAHLLCLGGYFGNKAEKEIKKWKREKKEKRKREAKKKHPPELINII